MKFQKREERLDRAPEFFQPRCIADKAPAGFSNWRTNTSGPLGRIFEPNRLEAFSGNLGAFES